MNEELAPAVTAEQAYLSAVLEDLEAVRKAYGPAVTTADVPLREPVKRRRGRPKKKRGVGA